MLFSEKLRMLIENRELTQKEVAKRLQIPVSTLGGYVQGTSEPDFQTLKMLASFFDVSIDYLLDYEHEPTSCESEIVKLFRSLTPQQQSIYLEQGKAFLKVCRHNDIN